MRTKDTWDRISQRINAGYIPGGDKSLVYSSGVSYYEQFIAPWDFICEGNVVMDIGCGNGRIAMALADRIPILYYGSDIIDGSIQFCKGAFSSYPNFNFWWLDITNEHYYPRNSNPPQTMRLPYDDDCADVVLAISLFTHISQVEGRDRYLQEIWRIVKPGGYFYSTWLRSPPNPVHPGDDRTVWPQEEIERCLENWIRIQSAGGEEPQRSDANQWRILVQKPIQGAGIEIKHIVDKC